MSKKKDKAPKPEEAPEAGAEGAEGAEPAKKKSPLKLIIIAAVAGGVLVLGGGGAGAYFFLLKPKPKAGAEADAAHGADAKKKDAKKDAKKEGEGAAKPAGPNDPVIADGPEGVVYYTPPTMQVNMQSDTGKAPLLQVKLTFEVPDHETADAMTADMPRMKDMLEGFLSELRQEDLDGSQGRFQLKMEILRRANLIVAPDKINAVNIEDLLVS